MSSLDLTRSIAFFLGILLAVPAHACECVTTHVRDRFISSEYVFVGKVSEIYNVELKGFRGPVAQFRVSKWFTNGKAPQLTLLTDSCGALLPDHEYLVFASCWTELIANRGCETVDLATLQGRRDLRALSWRAWLWRLERRFMYHAPEVGDKSKCLAEANNG